MQSNALHGGIDVPALEEWASSPSSAYVAITPNDADLENLFKTLAQNIVKTGATNIVITDKVKDCFEIIAVSSPDKGNANIINNNTVEWKIDELGVTESEGATMEFTVQHLGPCSGEIEVNESLNYSDNEGNKIDPPSPQIDINCDVIVQPEPCSTSVDFDMNNCSDSTVFDAGEIALQSLGRIVQIDVKLKNICPNKRVALGVILYEIDKDGNEYQRGLKTFAIPAHNRQICQNVLVKCIKFVLPENLDNINLQDSMCSTRKFRVNFISHYIDNEFICCRNSTL